MYIREISVDELEEFAKNNEYDNFRQTISYALFKCEDNSEYEIIGYGDKEKLYAAAVVIVKMIDNYIYAYVPHGFLINYNDVTLLSNFTKDLIKYYRKDDITFIKVNPPCKIAKYDKNYHKEELYDNRVIYNMQCAGYKYLGKNLNFEALLPRFDGVIDLTEFDDKNLTKNCRNKVRKAIRKGLKMEFGTVDQINIINDIIGNKIGHSQFYYNDYFNVFSRKNEIDYFLISINYETCLKNSTTAFEIEQDKNEKLVKKVGFSGKPRLLNKKMNSDRAMLSYKNDIAIATKNLYNGSKYIAAGLVVKHGNTASIILTGYDKAYKSFAPNYLLYYEIINYYKDKFEYLTLNGMSGDFSKESKYYGLNKFKMEFNPNIYEYAGEFDLIIDHKGYNYLLKKNYLAEEFNK